MDNLISAPEDEAARRDREFEEKFGPMLRDAMLRRIRSGLLVPRWSAYFLPENTSLLESEA